MNPNTTPFIFQIVGYTDSGKTTLVTKWIKRIKAEGMKVATIKHHGHGGPVEAADDGTDSFKHRLAGAAGSLVASKNEMQMHITDCGDYTLEQLIDMYRFLSPEVIIVEGFKREMFPKLVLHRGGNEDDELLKCSDVKAVICWEWQDVERMKSRYSHVFHIEQDDKYLDWLMNWMEGKE